MKGKLCIVTGANSGIGKVVSMVLAKYGATVVMICRNREKGLSALQEIKEKTGNKNVKLMIADLSLQKEIRKVAFEISSKYPKIHILINNAGTIIKEYAETTEGIEKTFATNHLAYFLLTNLLLKNLKAAENARIINVASEAERNGKINFGDLGFKSHYTPFRAYAQSKLANILFTYELARKLKGSRISVNCMHPGFVHTNFGKDLDGIFKTLYPLAKAFMKTPQEGADTILWLALSPRIEGVTSKYFYDRKEIKSQPISYSLKVAKKLWDISKKMTQTSD